MDDAVVVAAGGVAPKNDVEFVLVEPPNAAGVTKALVVVAAAGVVAGVGLNVNPPGFGAAAAVVDDDDDDEVRLKEPNESGAAVVVVVVGGGTVEVPKMLLEDDEPKADDGCVVDIDGVPNADEVPKEGVGRIAVLDPKIGAAVEC